MILSSSLDCVPKDHLYLQIIIWASHKILWEFLIPQGERGGLWRCEHKGSRRLHPVGSRNCYSQQDDEVQSLNPWSSCTGQDCARRPAYFPSNQHSWRVLGCGVRNLENPLILLLNSPFLQSIYVALVRKHCKHKKNLHYVRIKISILTCTLSQGPSKLQILLWTNPELAMHTLWDLCGNPTASGVQWRMDRFPEEALIPRQN